MTPSKLETIAQALRDARISEAVKLDIARAARLDRDLGYATARSALAAADHAEREGNARRAASEARRIRRQVESIAPTLDATDAADVQQIMHESKLDPFAAASELGRRRAAAKAHQS